MRDLTSDAAFRQRQNPGNFRVQMDLTKALFEAPIPREEILTHLPIFQDRRCISRILYMNEVYQRIVGVHGSVFEFGVRYGPTLALLTSLRGIYEPFNANRKIVGFDTFEGFLHVDKERDSPKAKKGDFAVPKNYEEYLEKLLMLHEAMGPLENLKRFELVKGDVTRTLPAYLKKHSETVISLAHFDIDLYRPTKICLKAILPFLNKGAVIAFDEINLEDFSGETIAFRELLGGKFRLIHSPFRAVAAYLVYE